MGKICKNSVLLHIKHKQLECIGLFFIIARLYGAYIHFLPPTKAAFRVTRLSH